jgi:hypothetical protein
MNKELGQLLKAAACVNREFLELPDLNMYLRDFTSAVSDYNC